MKEALKKAQEFNERRLENEKKKKIASPVHRPNSFILRQKSGLKSGATINSGNIPKEK
jgi:hypothetical protein